LSLLRHPVAQFVAAATLIVVAVALGTDVLSRRAAEQEAVADARTSTELLARSVVEPLLPNTLPEGNLVAAAGFDYAARDRLMVDNVRRVKIWNTEGLIVYSDRLELVGERFELSDGARAVLDGGGVDGRVSDLDRPENRYELSGDGFLEIYTRVETDDGVPLLFEVYYSGDELAENSQTILSSLRPLAIGGPLLLVVLTTPLLWAMTRRLARAAESRERLLQSAVEVSERERRRIARDLHEGVVHQLTAASAALATEASAADTPPALAFRLNRVDDVLRSGVTSLRSLVLQIYPPDLDAARLPGALDELLRPAEQAGLEVNVRVEGLESVGGEAAALVWRVSQEGVRNALRHARAKRLDLSVRRTGRIVALRLTDDGVGFVPGAFARYDRFGLRSLQDLAREAGGRLDVESGPGRGTTLRLDVPVA
jgi:signal transduction histidine kinase